MSRRQWTPEQLKCIERDSARRNYEYLLLHQPHLELGGLWEIESKSFFVLSDQPVANLRTRDGGSLEDWLDKNREITSRPLAFVQTLPAQATRIPERDVAELVSLSGESLRTGDLADELALRLPSNFPHFGLGTSPPLVIVTVQAPLSEEEGSALVAAFDEIGTHMTLEVKVADVVHRRSNSMGLIASSQLPKAFSRETKWFCQEDDGFWGQARLSLYGDSPPRTKDVLKGSVAVKGARCILDATAFAPPNIREVLPLYEKVAICLPLAGSLEKNLAALSITEPELLYLAEIGRVEVVLPMSLERYDANLLAKLVEQSPDALLGPRRLAAAMVTHARRSVPFLYPGVGIRERHAALKVLWQGVDRMRASDTADSSVLELFLRALQACWDRQEYTTQRMGAFGVSGSGIGSILKAFATQVTGKDLTLELLQPAQHVEMGAALGATVVPLAMDGYSSQPLCELCATFLRGAPSDLEVLDFARVQLVMDGILGVETDRSIREISEVFRGADVNRLRTAVSNIVERNQEPEYLQEAIEQFNAKVRKFNRRTVHLSRIGLAGALAGLAAWAGLTGVWVPFTVLGVNFLLQGPEYKGVPGWLLDTIRGANAGTSSEVVLVSRIKRG